MNPFQSLAKSAVRAKDIPCVICGNESISYEEMRERALTVGGSLLSSGLSTGDRVAFVMGNSPRIIEILYGCFAAGLVAVPVNARLHAREVAYIVENSGASVLIHDAGHVDGIAGEIDLFGGLTARYCTSPAEGASDYAELLEPENGLEQPVDTDIEDPVWLFYTSGTTGRPKGATWTARTVSAIVLNYLCDIYNIRQGSSVLHVAPMSHGSGIVALPAIARGATNVILDTPSFNPEAMFELIERHRIAHVAFVAPTQILMMNEAFERGRFDLSSLEAVCYGGAPIYVDQLRRAMDLFGPVFAQIYGQGEAPITITGMSAETHAELREADDPRIGSAGTVRTDVESHAVDADGRPLTAGQAGEIVVRGDVVMKGYWNDPEATEAAIPDGWLRTGDIGMFDQSGYLFLLDRAKDMIVSGGNNVYPREVEEVLAKHPEIENAVVLGIPDDHWGEAVHAVIVAAGNTDLSASDVMDFCGSQLAGYKKPKSVEFVDELPTSGYGKVMRREMREKYWTGHDRKVGGGGVSTVESQEYRPSRKDGR